MDTLSIESASAMQQSQVANKVAWAVAKKSMDIQKFQGQAAANLVQQAANVSQQISQGHIDVEL